MNIDLTGDSLEDLGVRGILDTLADGVYLTDRHRRILFWNEAASRITGWARSEVAGRTCYDDVLMHVDSDGHRLCGQEHCPLHRAIVTGEPSREPILVFARHQAGHRVPVEVTVAPIRNAAGEVIGGIETFRDLTRMQDDLHRARVIQDQMLEMMVIPDPRLQVAIRHTPCDLVGGDFYHAEAIDSDHYAFFVADVMGHGLASALYTMQLRVLWDDARELLGDAGRFMAEINLRLEPLVRAEGYFATAVLVVLHAATGRMLCVRAGHPPPLLRSPGGAVATVGRASPALGLMKEARYRTDEAQLGPGETLLMFTDGAVETGHEGTEDLGLEGLRRLLGAMSDGGGGAALEELERGLLRASGAIRLPDDLTLLSVSRVGTI